jgi:hypothetical protein
MGGCPIKWGQVPLLQQQVISNCDRLWWARTGSTKKATEWLRKSADTWPILSRRSASGLLERSRIRRANGVLKRRSPAALAPATASNVQRGVEIRAALDAQKKRLPGLRSQRDELAVLQRQV